MWFKRNFYNIKLSVLIKTFYLLFIILICFGIREVFFKDRNVKILLWWTNFMLNRDRVVECSPMGYKCILTTNRGYISDTKLGAILFYGSRIENNDFPLPRNTRIPWAIYHEESPKNYAPFLYKETQDLFNITSTFSRHSDYPVTLQYLKNITHLKDLKYFIPTKSKNQLLGQLSPILYVQSDCDTPIGRDYVVKELSKYITIDSYGTCLNNKSFPEWISNVYPLDLYNEDYMLFVSKYKFIISIENAICDDYVTEKFWRPLIVGSVPIYLGAPNIEDWLPNKDAAILVKDFPNIELLADFIKKVNLDDHLYDSFLEHKLSGKVKNDLLTSFFEKEDVEHPLPEFECHVCKTVHEYSGNYKIRDNSVYNCEKPVIRSNEKNTWDQHWDIGKCKSKALRILIEKNEPYSKDIFYKTWKDFYINRDC